jgi:hypothetical protein
MKNYPLLKRAAQKRNLDLVYLDTTYGHPKHDFVPQEEAIDRIAREVEEVLKDTTKGDTLILLSCYSIGKEKVLWETACHTNQLIYASEKKLKLLKCVRGHEEEQCSQIIEKCTSDPSNSDIHVIPMGLGGEMWPFFRPNYYACMEYADKLEKRYHRIVVFLPTGWANGSNWNKKNAVTQKQINYKNKTGSVQVQIRLISYSEHSAFSELESFVSFLKPRKVIPTVFADENDRRKIENRFRNLIDSTRAKQDFFKLMTKSTSTSRNTSASATEANSTTPTSLLDKESVASLSSPNTEQQSVHECSSSLSVPSSKKRKQEKTADENHINTLIAMGFNRDRAKEALIQHADNVEAALDHLLRGSSQAQGTSKQPIEIKNTETSPVTVKGYFSNRRN